MRLSLAFALAVSFIATMQAQERQGVSQGLSSSVKQVSSGSSSGDVLVIRIRDKCDPVTFDRNVFPGACVGDGNVTFDQFIAELTEDKKVGAWRFNPDQTDAKPGQLYMLESRGGETHTFTNVVKFGGGILPPLNELSGNPVPAPECVGVLGSFDPKDAVPAGAVIGPKPLAAGEQKFQCCIHPWMRLTVNAK